MLKYILALAVLSASTSATAQTSTNKTPEGFVTVCEVLGNRGFYDGKVIGLIGRWSPTDEGFWLDEECEIQIKTGDYVWKTIIVLKYDSSSPSIFSNGPTLDRAAANKKIADLKASRRSSNDKRSWAVVYGRIETKEDLPTVVSRDEKSMRPAGYGHLGGAPAQIVYREKDVVIIQEINLELRRRSGAEQIVEPENPMRRTWTIAVCGLQVNGIRRAAIEKEQQR